MELTNKEWKDFKIGDVFSVSTGTLLSKSLLRKGKTPRLTATDNNNGIFDFYENVDHKNYRVLSNFISVSFLGSVFYHPYSASLDMKIHAVQIPNVELNRYIGEFLVFCFRKMTANYSYGDQLSSTDLPKKKVLLPINYNGTPDYIFMESYMKQKETELLEKYKNHISLKQQKWGGINLNSKIEWKEFKLTELFDFVKGDQNNMASIKAGSVPLVSAKKSDNGYKDFVLQTKKLYQGNSLTLNNDGDGGAGISYYQPTNYLLDSHVTALYPKNRLNKFALLYISRCITAQQDKFGHGYSINNQRLKVFKLMLPATKQGKPDFVFMENYMKKLEYEKLKLYLDYKKLNEIN